MPGSDVRLVVSVQAHGFVDKPWEGHLATGVLVVPDEVLVPSAPAELIEAARGGLDLLLLPLPLDGGGRVERLAVEHVHVSSTLPDGGDRFAVLRVGNRSRHEPQVKPFRGADLGRALRKHGGDLWAALKAIGAIAPGVRDAVTQDLLRQAALVEDAQREPVFDHRASPPGPTGVCEFIKACTPSEA